MVSSANILNWLTINNSRLMSNATYLKKNNEHEECPGSLWKIYMLSEYLFGQFMISTCYVFTEEVTKIRKLSCKSAN